MMTNNPLVKLWEALGRAIDQNDIIHAFNLAANQEAFVAEMIHQAGEGGLLTTSKRQKIERLAYEFVVWWSIQVHA